MDENNPRGYFAEILIGFSLVGLTAVSIAVIVWGTEPGRLTVVFNNLLPLFGTWIGMVIAYYFSSSNFAMAGNAYKKFASPAPCFAGTPVTAAMIRKSKIAGLVKIQPGQSPSDISLQHDLLSKMTPPTTRIPVVDACDAIKYVIHENTLYKYITKTTISRPAPSTPLTTPASATPSTPSTTPASATPTPPSIPSTSTLQDLLDDVELGHLLNTFVVVPSSFTLADTKKKMNATPNCKDAFVTQTGNRSDPIIGWITDTKLIEFARF